MNNLYSNLNLQLIVVGISPCGKTAAGSRKSIHMVGLCGIAGQLLYMYICNSGVIDIHAHVYMFMYKYFKNICSLICIFIFRFCSELCSSDDPQMCMYTYCIEHKDEINISISLYIYKFTLIHIYHCFRFYLEFVPIIFDPQIWLYICDMQLYIDMIAESVNIAICIYVHLLPYKYFYFIDIIWVVVQVMISYNYLKYHLFVHRYDTCIYEYIHIIMQIHIHIYT